MPRRPTIHQSTLENAFGCAQCNRQFRSKAGRTRHVNAKHGGLKMNSESRQSSTETTGSDFSEVSSCPNSQIPAPPSQASLVFDTLSHTGNSDTFNFGENDFNDGDRNESPPLSLSQDTASILTEYHPYLNGKSIL